MPLATPPSSRKYDQLVTMSTYQYCLLVVEAGCLKHLLPSLQPTIFDVSLRHLIAYTRVLPQQQRLRDNIIMTDLKAEL